MAKVSTKEAALSFLMRYLVVIVLISIGALVFQELENVQVVEERTKIDLKKFDNIKAKEMLRQQLSAHLNVTVNTTVFDTLVNNLKALKDEEKPNTWTFETAGNLAFTIVSTVGYGVIVPKRNESKIVCMLYAIIGIPIYLYAIAAAGTFKKCCIEKMLYLIEIKIMKKDEIKEMNNKIMVFTIILYFVEMLIFSASIIRIEKNWSYLECFYFWFITASTIGFGDYVLAYDGNNRFQAGFQFLSILFALILQSGLATIFETLQDMIEERAKNGKKICGCFGMKRKDQNSVEITPTELPVVEKDSS